MLHLTLDPIDDQIIEMLSQNARLSYVEIGNAVGLSSVAVRKRIEILEKEGIIDGYIAIINPLKAAKSISMFFDINVVSNKINEVVSILKDDPHVTQLYLLTGDAKLHVHGIFTSAEDRAGFMRDVIYNLPYISSLSSHDIIDRIKDIKSVRL